MKIFIAATLTQLMHILLLYTAAGVASCPVKRYLIVATVDPVLKELRSRPPFFSPLFLPPP